MKRLLLHILWAMALGLASCPKSTKEPDPLALQFSESAPEPVERMDPLWNSYPAAISAKPLSRIRLEEGGFASLNALAQEETSTGAAYIGLRRYSLENGRTLILASSDGRADYADPAELRYGKPFARWVSEYAISAGPTAFSDAVLVGTAEPSLVFLDPLTLAPLSVLPLEHLPLGRIGYGVEENLLRLFHGDGSVGYYGVSSDGPEPSDLVATLIGPEPRYREVLDEILLRKLPPRLKDRLASLAVDPYGPRSRLSHEGIALFRYDAESADPLRLFLDGADSRPYLILVFDAQGSAVASNIEYAAASVLEFHPSIGEVYYVAAAFLDDRPGTELAEADRSVRLVVAEKKP